MLTRGVRREIVEVAHSWVEQPWTKMRGTRPLVVLDLETTGTSTAEDRIVEIAMVRVDDGEVTPRRRVLLTLVDPKRPIPKEATAIHGIGDLDVIAAEAPTFQEIALLVLEMLEGADVAGFNVLGFDLPLLEAELRRALPSDFDLREGRSVIDVFSIFQQREPRDLAAAVKFYLGVAAFRPLHSAMDDVQAAAQVLGAQFTWYEDLPRDRDALDAYSARRSPDAYDRDGKLVWKDGELVLTFGKHAGRTLRSLAASAQDRGFLDWIGRKEFSAAVKHAAREALSGRFPTRGGAA